MNDFAEVTNSMAMAGKEEDEKREEVKVLVCREKGKKETILVDGRDSIGEMTRLVSSSSWLGARDPTLEKVCFLVVDSSGTDTETKGSQTLASLSANGAASSR